MLSRWLLCAMAAPDAPVRQSIAQRLREARAWTDGLFRLLTPAGLLERPIAERHRLLFYVGHLEAFDWNLICRDVLGERSSRPTFEQLFAFGIDPVDGNLPSDQPSDWPQLEELQAWNRELREAVDRAHAVALANGCTCEGAPGLRPHYHPNYYGAYLRDTEGNKLCVACHSAAD